MLDKLKVFISSFSFTPIRWIFLCRCR